jgi:hypothetical protein
MFREDALLQLQEAEESWGMTAGSISNGMIAKA